MKAIYPVLFTETKECFLVEVPDLGILTEGNDLNDAIEMARDAIELKCISLEDDEQEIPLPSDGFDANNGTFSNDGMTFVYFVDIDSEEYRRKIDIVLYGKIYSICCKDIDFTTYLLYYKRKREK